MGRVERTVFISYRRKNVPWALCIYQYLTHHGFDVFFDYQSIKSGDFERTIIENIKHRAHFLVVLTPSALERCNKPGDWLRREIETAIDEKRNIVPLILEGFDFGNPKTVEALTGKLENLKRYNGLEMPASYFIEAMGRLRKDYLNIPIEAVLQPLSEPIEKITKEQKVEASKADPVEKNELTAQEWFSRGYLAGENKNYEEAIRFYNKTLDLNPNDAFSYSNLGIQLAKTNRFKEAEIAYRKSIGINPDLAQTHSNLGALLDDLDRFKEAEVSFRKAIEVDPEIVTAHSNLGALLSDLGRFRDAEAALHRAIEIDPEHSTANFNFACLRSLQGEIDKAFVLLEKAITKGYERANAWQDPDLELLRKDKRFEEIVGPNPN